MDAAMDRAADVIYRRHQRGGPCIAGDLKSGVISILTFVDDEDCDAWLPQLRALCLAIEGKIDSVTVGRRSKPGLARAVDASIGQESESSRSSI